MPTLTEIKNLTTGRHSARTMDFDFLRHGLWQHVKTGHIGIQFDDAKTLEIYSYTHKCMADGIWDQFTLTARGLILEPDAKRVVATPFPKFFNWGEFSYDMPEGAFSVTEKMDGSLGIIFWHNDRWHVSTRGSLMSDQAIWAAAWLEKNVNTNHLHPGYTYLVEIIYPENRIVISYEFDGLILLGAYNEFGDEMPFAYLEDVGSVANIQVVEAHEFDSVDEIAAVAKTLSHEREGFVIRFDDGFRMKIKGDEYCRVHRLVSNVTPLGIWSLMVACDDMDGVRNLLPEEFHRDFNEIHRLLQLEFDSRLDELRIVHEGFAHLSDKELGLALKSNDLEVSTTVKNFIFPCRKKNLLEEVHEAGKFRTMFFKRFRPSANKLEGYVPSTLLNRFSEESE